jgi:hypothetical protein
MLWMVAAPRCGASGQTAPDGRDTDALEAADDGVPDAAPDEAADAVPDHAPDALPDDRGDGPAEAGDDVDGVADVADGGTPAWTCRGTGVGGHLQLALAYWTASAAYGNHLAEPVARLGAGHIDLATLAGPLPDGIDVVVDLHWNLFDYERHAVRSDLAAQLDAVDTALAGRLHRVQAFYLIDEPYIAGHEIRREELELAIAAVHAGFPGIPTYITFAHHCFDPASTDAACVVPPDGRGVPAGLDWAAFDWYNDSNDPAAASAHVANVVRPGVDRLAALAPGVRILLVPEAYTDGRRTEGTVLLTLHDYFDLAVEDPRIFGIDFFLWADAAAEGFSGLHSLFFARAAAYGFARLIRRECGETPDRIPVTQWYRGDMPDYRYEAWHWSGAAAGYIPHGVAFVLPPAGTPGSAPLYHCLLDRAPAIDSYLTRDAACDGVATVSPPTVLGGIFAEGAPDTVPLRRYTLDRAPWDHVFTIDPAPLLPPGYVFDFVIGGVYPLAAL